MLIGELVSTVLCNMCVCLRTICSAFEMIEHKYCVSACVNAAGKKCGDSLFVRARRQKAWAAYLHSAMNEIMLIASANATIQQGTRLFHMRYQVTCCWSCELNKAGHCSSALWLMMDGMLWTLWMSSCTKHWTLYDFVQKSSSSI